MTRAGWLGVQLATASESPARQRRIGGVAFWRRHQPPLSCDLLLNHASPRSSSPATYDSWLAHGRQPRATKQKRLAIGPRPSGSSERDRLDPDKVVDHAAEDRGQSLAAEAGGNPLEVIMQLCPLLRSNSVPASKLHDRICGGSGLKGSLGNRMRFGLGSIDAVCDFAHRELSPSSSSGKRR